MADVARHKRSKGRSRFSSKKSERGKKLKLNPKISDHFAIRDFKCRQDECDCKKKMKVSLGLIGGLELLREKCKNKVTIVKGYECAEKAEKSLYKNYHPTGIAAIITVANMSSKEVVLVAETINEFQGIGLDLDTDTVYVDTRKDTPQKWISEQGKRTLLAEDTYLAHFNQTDTGTAPTSTSPPNEPEST